MKRTYRYALGAILSAALIVPAIAQDNFPDVPANHWAYEALAKMKKDGLLVGYPDGLFRGPRPASRYELAVAINATYTALKNQVDGLDAQVKALGDKINGMNGGVDSSADIKNLRDQLTSLQNDVNGMKGWGDDIANLKRMADTFQKELNSLGVDVEAMKKDLGDINDRLTKLEKRKPAVDISGDINLWMGMGNSRDNNYGLNKDGRINGTSNALNPFGTGGGSAGPGGGPVGLSRDVSIFHEGAFTFAGTNDTGPKWRGTLVVTNMLADQNSSGTGFVNQSSRVAGIGYSEPSGDVYLQDFGVKFDTSVSKLAFNVEAGRVGYKISPYIFQRPDETAYFDNDRWDNGLWRFDGAILGFNFGGAKLDVFAGKNSKVLSTGGVELNPMEVQNTFVSSNPVPGTGAFTIDRSLGLNLNVPISTAGNLNLSYLWLDSDTAFTGPIGSSVAPRNRVNVYGGTADYNMGRIKLEGGYSATTQSFNNTDANNGVDFDPGNDNTAWWAKVHYSGEKFGIWGGYRQIEDQYIAPGDWGRLGIIRNPGNIKGWQAGASLNISHAITLNAMGEWDQGIKDVAANPFFSSNTHVQKYAADLNVELRPNLAVTVGHEYNHFTDQRQFGGSPARYAWSSVGVKYGLSSAAKLLIKYEISDISGEFTGVGSTPGGVPISTYRGGFLTTQLSVKF